MRKINLKCKRCSKKSFRDRYTKKPDCWIADRCGKKRSYYRKLTIYRQKYIKYHRYRKFCGDHCVLCKNKTKLEVHHIVPQVRGGIDTPLNTITLCHKCHMVITKYYRTVGWDRRKKW